MQEKLQHPLATTTTLVAPGPARLKTFTTVSSDENKERIADTLTHDSMDNSNDDNSNDDNSNKSINSRTNSNNDSNINKRDTHTIPDDVLVDEGGDGRDLPPDLAVGFLVKGIQPDFLDGVETTVHPISDLCVSQRGTIDQEKKKNSACKDQ